MMSFGWMLRNTLDRMLLAAMLFAAFAYCGKAQAQDYSGCTNQGFTGAYCPDEGAALLNATARSQAMVDQLKASSPSLTWATCAPVHVGPIVIGSQSFFRWVVQYGNSGLCSTGDSYRDYLVTSTCASKASYSTLFSPPGGSTDCRDGCAVTYIAMGQDSEGRPHSMVDYTGAVCTGGKEECNAKNPGGTTPPTWVWNSALGVCQPVEVQCQPGAHWENGACTLDDGCALGFVLNAQNVCVKGPNDCAAGATKAPDGSCLNSDDGNKCGPGKAKGKDGTCKKDTDGDGKPDDEEEGNNEDGGKFSGGDDCNVPPTCSGDNIMCGSARIQWRIDCNTRRKDAINGGACSVMPTCVGQGCKPIEHAMLIQQWRTACELEKLNSKSPGAQNPGDGTATPGTADYSLQQVTEDAAGEAGDLGTDGEGPDGVFTDESRNNDGQGGVPGSNGPGSFDITGLGYSRSCPTIPPVNVFGTLIQFDIQPVCDWLALGGMLVLLLTSLTCLRIATSTT